MVEKRKRLADVEIGFRENNSPQTRCLFHIV